MRIIKYIFKNYFSFKANTQVFPIAVSVAKNESIDPTKGILNNNIETITIQNIIVFCIYTIIILTLATRMFRIKMKSDNK